MTEGIGQRFRARKMVGSLQAKAYTDDIKQVGQTHAYFVRSPHAHADVVSIDVEEALWLWRHRGADRC